MSTNTHTAGYFEIAAQICRDLDHAAIEKMAEELAALRARNGRLFLIGVGGSAANCSHAVNDFRKLCNIEAYAPTDNVAELTARTNDEGWDTVFAAWLATSRAGPADGLMVFSVGGGSVEHNVSVNIVQAVDEAKRRQLKIFGIVGRDGGHTQMMGDHVIRVPVPDNAPVTPHTEAFQAVVWHCIVCHPGLMAQENKWEGLKTL
jgi:D-sedoheptulose 7-phosphate isomerase